MASNERSLVKASASAPSTSVQEFDLQTLGKIFAASKLFADAQDAAKAMVKVLAARELGFGSFAGMSGVYIVKGRVTLSANLMAAAIQNSKRFRFKVKELTNTKCTINFEERDEDSGKWELVGPSTFTVDDAKTAGLITGDNWRKYPRNMLYARAMSNGARWYTPSVFAGSPPYLPDELEPSAKMSEDGEFTVVEAHVVSSTESVILPGVDDVKRLLEETETDVSKVLAHYQVNSLEELNDAAIGNVTSLLKAKLDAK